MPARFFDPILLDNRDLKIGGPFSTDGELVGDVQIRFLIIEKPDDDERSTTPPWMVDSVAWFDGRGDTFEHVVPARWVPAGVREGATARGIGLAVMVKRFPDPSLPPAPPAFETLTWCVDLTIKGEAVKA